MPRIKSSITRKARVKKVLKQAKSYYGKRKNIFSIANQSVIRSGAFAFAHRRKKKGDFRALWAVRINAAAKLNGTSYSRLINGLKKANVLINRKILSDLAINDATAFSQIVELANKDS